jgi:hypothetical protein
MFGELQIPDDVKAQAAMFPATQSLMLTMQIINEAIATSNTMYESEKAKIAAKEEARDEKRALLRKQFEADMRALDDEHDAGGVQLHRANIAEVKAVALPLYTANFSFGQKLVAA